MTETPNYSDPRGARDATFAAQDCRDRDNVIGIGRMAHPEYQPEQRDSEWCRVIQQPT